MRLVRLTESANTLMDYADSKRNIERGTGYAWGMQEIRPVQALWQYYINKDPKRIYRDSDNEWFIMLGSVYNAYSNSNSKGDSGTQLPPDYAEVYIEILHDGAYVASSITSGNRLNKRFKSEVNSYDYWIEVIDWFDKLCKEFNKCKTVRDVYNFLRKNDLDTKFWKDGVLPYNGDLTKDEVFSYKKERTSLSDEEREKIARLNKKLAKFDRFKASAKS